MPWQQIKLKPAWKKEALKCCHMQDCMGTSWGTHVVLGLSERCWVCVVYRVRHSMVDHSTMITENSNSWWSIIFCENVIFKTCQFWTGQRLLDTMWRVTRDNQLHLNVECQSADIFWTWHFIAIYLFLHPVTDWLLCWHIFNRSLRNLICFVWSPGHFMAE